MEKLRVFVGSSTEAKEIDSQVRLILEDCDIEVISWRNTFKAGEFGLESLLRISTEIDAAILISTADDKIWYRGTNQLSPRDNIIFEAGLFIKALGRKRVAILSVKNNEGIIPKLPTDLNGLSFLPFEMNKSGTNENQISNWLTGIKSILHTSNTIYKETLKIITDTFSTMPEIWTEEIRKYIISPFKISVKDSIHGKITLNLEQYYQSLYSEMSEAGEYTEICASSTLSNSIWTKDIYQQRYMEFNTNAINKGAKIRRLFVLDQTYSFEIESVIEKQRSDGILVRLINPKLFFEELNLDIVIFINKKEDTIKSYTSTKYYNNSDRLKGGNLYLKEDECNEQLEKFNRIWEIAHEPIIKETNKQIDNTKTPPGNNLKIFKLKSPVVSCVEASKARNIPIQNELKTLIVYTSGGFIAVNLPGDGRISLRKIKNILNSNEACLADPEDLAEMGLSAGTVSAVLDPVWSMPQLISKRLLKLDYITTNNGTKTGYFKFKPSILLNAENITVGDFEKE